MSSIAEFSHTAFVLPLALTLAGVFTAALIAGFRFWPFRNRTDQGPRIEPLPPRAELVQQSRGLEVTNGELRNRLNELSLLYEVAKSFTSTLELPEVLTRISTLIGEKLQIPQFSIMLLDQKEKLVVKNAYPTLDGNDHRSFQVGEGACGRAAHTRRAVYLPDVAADQAIFARRNRGESGSLLSIPMVHQGNVLGVLNFQRPQSAGFSPEEIEVLTTIADQGALAIKNALLHEQMVALSITDPLTGISNRRHLASRLEMEIDRANRFGTQVSVVMADIDWFKKLNDALGHRVGDIILQQLAALLEGVIRKVDLLARYGGEEFVVVLPQVPKADAVQVAEKLRRLVESATFGAGTEGAGARMTISLGVANLPVDGVSSERLLDCADAALYASKRAGRNQVSLYAPGMEFHPGRERGPYAGKRRRPEPLRLSPSAPSSMD